MYSLISFFSPTYTTGDVGILNYMYRENFHVFFIYEDGIVNLDKYLVVIFLLLRSIQNIGEKKTCTFFQIIFVGKHEFSYRPFPFAKS
jgi:hypothetical protein